MKPSILAVAAALLLPGAIAWAKPVNMPAAAPWQADCGASDVGLAGIGACKGYFEGNLLSNGQPVELAITQAVHELGVNDYTRWLEKFAGGPTTGGPTLFGDTVIGVYFNANHWGSNKPQGGATAFFHFDAGSTGFSAAGFAADDPVTIAVYKTGAAPLVQADAPPQQGEVPEPGTAALLLVGLGLAAVSARFR